MFQTVRDAGLMPHEVARIIKVSRVTASMWLNGHTKPHRLLADKVAKFLDAVSSAVDAGDLPVPPDLKRKERAEYLTKTLVKHLSKPADRK